MSSPLPLRFGGPRIRVIFSYTFGSSSTITLPLSCYRIKTSLSFIAIWSDLIASFSFLLMFDFDGLADAITPRIAALKLLALPSNRPKQASSVYTMYSLMV